MGHVVGDADREAPLGSLAGELVEHGGDHPGVNSFDDSP